MNARRLALAAAAVLLATSFTASSAHAQWGGRGIRAGFFNPYLGNAFGSSLYSLGRVPVPPYFSLHPPVSYSGITPTTYGTSPFARLPSREFDFPVHELPEPVTPQKEGLRLKVQPGPQVVINPFYRPDGKTPAKAPRNPRIVRNPYR